MNKWFSSCNVFTESRKRKQGLLLGKTCRMQKQRHRSENLRFVDHDNQPPFNLFSGPDFIFKASAKKIILIREVFSLSGFKDVLFPLQMKLQKKKSASMDKIMSKLRKAQLKAQEMRKTTSANQAPRTSRKVMFLHRYPKISLTCCFRSPHPWIRWTSIPVSICNYSLFLFRFNWFIARFLERLHCYEQIKNILSRIENCWGQICYTWPWT